MTPVKPPPKIHRKGQKPYNKDAPRPPRDGDSTQRPPRDEASGYSKKPYNKDGDRPQRDGERKPYNKDRGDSAKAPYEKKPYNKDAASPNRDGDKKPYRSKREDNPLLESAPRATRYAARFESKATTNADAKSTSTGRIEVQIDPNRPRAQQRRGTVKTPASRPSKSDDATAMRAAPARSTIANSEPTSTSSSRRSEGSAKSDRAHVGSVKQVRERLSTNTTTQSPAATTPIRLAKRMSDAGICSRREAERHIEAGRVSVNGQRITSCATLVSPADYVRFDDKLVDNTAQEVRLFLFHKPRGALTTNSDPEGRPTIYDTLPKDMPRVVSVGRLDFDSEGLLLLTTSGSLARTLELPATGLARTYRVRVHGTPSPEAIALLKRGMSVEGIHYGSMDVRVEDTDNEGRNRWLEVTLHEGKNREIRRVFTALEHHVTRLIRTHYGPFELGKLPRGAIIEMKSRDWKKSLRDVLPQES